MNRNIEQITPQLDPFNTAQVRAELAAVALTQAIDGIINAFKLYPAEMRHLKPSIKDDLYHLDEILRGVK